MRAVVRLTILAFAVVMMTGCYFDHPLTGSPSKDINTWLLGVWQSTDSKGRVSRAMVTPISRGRYGVELAIPGKSARDIKRFMFEAWSSRVGDTTFLTLRCLESSGEIPTGAHAFVQIQLLDQNNVRIRLPILDSDPSASAFELRKEVRAKLKSKTLYDEEKSSNWKRIEEVFWSTDGTPPAFTPLRNPTF